MKICSIQNFTAHYRKEINTLCDQSFDCDFVTGDKIYDIKPLDMSGFRNKVYILHNCFFGTNHIIWQRGALPFIFKKYDAYFITADFKCLSTWLIIILGHIMKKKIYAGGHGWYGKETVLEKKIKKIFYSMAYGITVYGDYAKKLMIKEGFDPKKIYVMHNSLEYSRQLAIREKLHSTDIYRKHFVNNNPVLIFIGRLTPQKKLELFIDAVHKLDMLKVETNIVFVGDGSEKEKLLKKVKEYNLKDKVWFYGACYDEMKNAELIYNADVCVAPGNVGLTAMHTMVYGTPVITHSDFAHQMPEFEAIVPGRTGAFFERNNIESLSEVIKAWLTDKTDRNQVRKDCYREIDANWNPEYTLRVKKQILSEL